MLQILKTLVLPLSVWMDIDTIPWALRSTLLDTPSKCPHITVHGALGGADDPRLTDATRCCFAKRISIAFSLPRPSGSVRVRPGRPSLLSLLRSRE